MSTASETVDETEAEAAPRPGLVLRLRRLLGAPLLLLERLRRPKPAAEEAEGEIAESGSRDGGNETTDEELEAPAARPLWRRLPPYAIVLALGAAAGGGGTYWLSTQAIARQAAELVEQRAEAARLKDILAGYDKLILQNRKKLEEEQGKRAELENRLATAQAELMRRPPAPAESRADAAARKPAASPAEAGKGGNCTLRPGTIGSSLKDCLAEFNRP